MSASQSIWIDPSTSTMAATQISDVTHFVTSAGGAEVFKTLGGVSKEGYYVEQLNFVISGVIAPVLCIPGLLGNLLAVVVWTRPSMASSRGRYLTAQALSDCGVLLFYFLNECLQAWEVPLVFRAPYGYFYSFLGSPLYFFCVIISIWCTVGVTVDLCLMVCWIFKAKAFCNMKVANTYIIILTMIAFLINIPNFFNYRPLTTTTTTTTSTTTNNNNNTSTTTSPTTTTATTTTIAYLTAARGVLSDSGRPMSFALTPFGSDDRGLYYQLFTHCLLVIILPWPAVFAMNIKVIYKIVQSNRRMADNKCSQSAKSSKDTETQITRVLLGVSFSYLVSVGFNCVVQCFWMTTSAKVDRYLVVSLYMFAKAGFVLNAASHFFFYCLLGKHFRAELKGLLRPPRLLASFWSNRKSSLLPVTKQTHSSDNNS